MTIDDILCRDAELIEQTLTACLAVDAPLAPLLLEAMRYSVLGGGKRIRPVLTLMACRMCGGEARAALPFACAVELVHCYSLVHDDLPCMDDDDLRRGKPSTHARFGEAIALLAGDALLTLAFETALLNDAVSPAAAVAAARVLAVAAGHSGMVGGQVIDLASEGHAINAAALQRMHAGKTGALIAAAVRMGCLAAGADSARQEAAGCYAEHLGLAFQITDDILDATADTATLGKRAGKDAAAQKSTYVTLFGPAQAALMAQEATEAAVRALDIFGRDAESLILLARLLAGRQK